MLTLKRGDQKFMRSNAPTFPIPHQSIYEHALNYISENSTEVKLDISKYF